MTGRRTPLVAVAARAVWYWTRVRWHSRHRHGRCWCRPCHDSRCARCRTYCGLCEACEACPRE